MKEGKRYCIEYLESLGAKSWKMDDRAGFDTLAEALRARAIAERTWPMARVWDNDRNQPADVTDDK